MMKTKMLGLLAASVLVFGAVAYAAPPDKPSKPSKLGNLTVCLDIDGGIVADHAADGSPIYYGRTAATQQAFLFSVQGVDLTLTTGTCGAAGSFTTGRKTPVTVAQTTPRVDAG